MAKATTKLTTPEAIVRVLSEAGKPMKVAEIIAAGVPLTALAGKTPGQQFYSVLYTENKRPDGIVVRAGRGEFSLNAKARTLGERGKSTKAANGSKSKPAATNAVAASKVKPAAATGDVIDAKAAAADARVAEVEPDPKPSKRKRAVTA